MIYKAIGVMSGSSLDGLDIVFVELTEVGGKWAFEILNTSCIAYNSEWTNKLKNACQLSALDYQLLHTSYGNFIGQQVNEFIENNNLHHKVNLVASHGHTTFHIPAKKMTAQLGDGAAIAAATKLPVVADLRSLDVAFGGQGAPIVPIGEKLLFHEYNYFLNLGGIANISLLKSEKYFAYDICAANRVLNMLAEEKGLGFDDKGTLAATGQINEQLLAQLNALDFYQQPFPKSLANSFGTDIIYPLIKNASLKTEDALRTYVEHICEQVVNAVKASPTSIIKDPQTVDNLKLLVTGGGAFNTFLINRLQFLMNDTGIIIEVPENKIIAFKEAVIMALIGVLRWREEENVLASVTGASKDSIGGALWLG